MSKKHKTPHFTPKHQHNKHHKRPAPDGAHKRRLPTPRVDDIRLVLESTAPDDELGVKIDHVKAEIQAVGEALGDEGPSYLGIVDKVSCCGKG